MRIGAAAVGSCFAIALAVAVSGCESEKVPPNAGVNRDRPITAGDSYVALGDSYTAAYLTGRTDRDSGPCLRSMRNYPRLLAAELDLELTDVSCGGATTDDVLAPATKSGGDVVPAQINALSDDTDLVTIGLGANDVQLYDAVVVNCVRLAATNPEGSPCQDIADAHPEQGKERIEELESKLLRVISAVLSDAPNARVIVVGYPQAFPPEGPCDALPLAEGDYQWAHETSAAVTDALKAAAQRADAEYVDLWQPTKGHDMCADDPWIAGAEPERDDGFAYHPYPEEQELAAELLAEQLTDPA